MKSRGVFAVVLELWIAACLSQLAWAESDHPTPPPHETSQTHAPSERSEASNSSKNHKKRKPREREAEGTQAPNRFDQDLIIKSRYELNGQSLEVDTD